MLPTFEYSPNEIALFTECGCLVEAESPTCPPVLIYATVLPAIILRHGITDWRRDSARRAMQAIELSNPLRLTDEFDALVAKPDDLGDPTYHDVEIFCDGKRYAISDSYEIDLACARAGGWSLWHGPIKLGEEFGIHPFEIRVRGVVVCKSQGKSEGGDE